MAEFDYKRYLASREWALLKRAVHERACGRCERCLIGWHEATHHLTYERIGRESLEDLLGVCRDCHAWLSATSEADPVLRWHHLAYAVWRRASRQGKSNDLGHVLKSPDGAVSVPLRVYMVVGRFCLETLIRESRILRPEAFTPNDWTMADYAEALNRVAA